jgi:hypothetical protein
MLNSDRSSVSGQPVWNSYVVALQRFPVTSQFALKGPQ